MTTYSTVLTTNGQAKIAAAIAAGTTVSLTQMAVGDGNGSVVTPVATQTALAREKYRAAINQIVVDPTNVNRIISQLLVPPSSGGYTIREVGLFAADGTLFAVSNFPETYKPTVSEGSSRDLIVRTVVQVGNASAVSLYVDTGVATATQNYVNDRSAWVEQLIVQGQLTPTPSDHTQLVKATKRLFHSNVTVKTSGVFLGIDDLGQVHVNVSADADIGLPSAALLGGVPVVFDLLRDDTTSATVNVWVSGSDGMDTGTHVSLKKGERIRLSSNGYNFWYVSYYKQDNLAYVQQGGGAGQTNGKVYLGGGAGGLRAQVDTTDLGKVWTDFGLSAAHNSPTGYSKLPNGLILQWSRLVIPTTTGIVWVFPVTFPTWTLTVQATKVGGSPDSESVTLGEPNNAGVSVDNYPGAAETPVRLFALGV